MAKPQKSRKGTRLLKTRTPKGRNVISYAKKKPDRHICARCEAKLPGLPRVIPSKLKKMSASSRTVQRKFGGVLCANCVKYIEKYKARMEDGFAVKRDLTIEKFLPSGWYASLPEKVKKKVIEESEAVRADVELKKVAELIAVDEAAEEAEKPKPKASKKEDSDAAEDISEEASNAPSLDEADEKPKKKAKKD